MVPCCMASSEPVAGELLFSPTIPQDFPPCYHSAMRHPMVLFIHFLATLVRLLGPGGVRSIVAESLLLKHQLLSRNFLLDVSGRAAVTSRPSWAAFFLTN